MSHEKLIDTPSTESTDTVLEHYQVERREGLDDSQVQKRLEKHGKNRLREAKKRSTLSIFVEQFRSVIVLLLIVASVLAFAFGDIVVGVAIVAVIVVNAAIGFFTELQAVRSMDALQQLGQVTARVRREGKIQEIDATEIVPGDVLIFEGGDVVTADARLLEAAKLQVDESALTGESVPVDKMVEPLDEQPALAERANMVFKGTSITLGSGEGVVVATGMETELGKISSLVEEAEDETTPLEKQLDQLGQKLIWLTLIITAFVLVTGVISGKDLRLMIETAIALAVASVPEGLPIVATIALARGMARMADRNALINQLSTVETLGATNIICTDKTGTLTENKMTVSTYQFETSRVEPKGEESDEELLERALRIGVLCNNASLQKNESEESAVGEPLEVALLQVGAKYDLYRDQLTEAMPEIREVAFDAETKLMATLHEQDDGIYVAVKGAPEAIFDVCTRIYTEDGESRRLEDDERDTWFERNNTLAGEGLRMLAIADKTVPTDEEDPYTELTFVGLVGLLDPPREGVREAIQDCRRAGIRYVMVTGDQPETARNIGMAVGLVEDDSLDIVHGQELKSAGELTDEERERMRKAHIFARVNPEQKLDIITLHQDAGMRVAMTGDGVNDAPALKKADIGIAMSLRGTQVAQEAADMILKDDALSTIVLAVRQGRVIFGNIRKFVTYLLSSNLSKILIVGLASLVSAPLPITPLQILFLNVVTDVFPALALGVGEGDDSIMQHPPADPDEAIINRENWLKIIVFSSLIASSVLATYAIALVGVSMTPERAVTVAFLTLAFAQLWHVFNMRETSASIVNNAITRNPWIWGALGLCTVLLLLATYVPFMQTVLDTANPGAEGWLLVIIGSLLPLLIWQTGTLFSKQFNTEEK